MADQTARELIAAALRKLGVLSRGKTINAADEADGLEGLKVLLREWNSKHLMMFVITKDTHTLTEGTESYTIGSGATIDTVRPVVIKGGFVKSSGIDYPLSIVGDAKYRNIREKDFGGKVAEFLWYNPGYSQGTIFLWPASGGVLTLDSLKPLTEPATITADVAFPGEYDAAIIWNLAVNLATEYGKEPTPFQLGRARETKNQIITHNAALSVQQVAVDYVGQQHSHYHIDQG